MPNTVIRLQEDAAGHVQFYLERPSNWPQSKLLVELQGDPAQPPYSGLNVNPVAAFAVRDAGVALLNDLRRHPAIAQQLAQVLNAPGMITPKPLGIEVESTKADSLPWEALYENTCAFLALDPRWPISRLLQANVDDVQVDYLFCAPLRIAAVLSAPGNIPQTKISSSDEWNSLKQAMATAGPANAGNIQVLALVCEQNLKDAVDASGIPGVRTEFIRDRGQLAREIRTFGPHILHFFCHGASEDPPYLRIGSLLNWEREENGTILFEGKDIRLDADPNQSVWLVVLNCCETASGGVAEVRGVRNLAANLVRSGFPAVLGMREPVDAGNARLLTQEFYRELFSFVFGLPVGGPPISVEWSTMLVEGRQTLKATLGPGRIDAACHIKEWAIPAIYVRMDPFRLRRVSPPNTLSDSDRQRLMAQLAELQKKRNDALQFPLTVERKNMMLAEFDAKINDIEKQFL